MRPDKRRALDKDNKADASIDKAEKLRAGVRAKVEHPFRVIKRQFGFVKTRYRGLKKNTAQLLTLFAQSNLWMGAQQINGSWGMSTLENKAKTVSGVELGPMGIENDENSMWLLEFHDLRITPLLLDTAVSYSDHP